MSISFFDVFTIGIGPSSSHTVGPMRASLLYMAELKKRQFWPNVARIKIELFGSLGLTGKAHGTEKAIILGLLGEAPEDVDPDTVEEKMNRVKGQQKLLLNGENDIDFIEETDLVFYRNRNLPLHPNGLTFTTYNRDGQMLYTKSYYSVGGGFVIDDTANETTTLDQHKSQVPYPFSSADELLKICADHNLKIWQVMYENEKTWRDDESITQGIAKIWNAMQESVSRGLKTEGILPGGLKVERRAPKIHKSLLSRPQSQLKDPLSIMDWVDVYAIAVNEENASGGRVVTAPTNGAAGIIPAVLHYVHDFLDSTGGNDIMRFLLTAGAIAILFKQKASISGAEVGCQGEVGVACSMAAGGLAEVMNGTNRQIENAAEIGMEHNLGLTCDPVGGLVQIPCIERNAMGAIKAINACRLALRGDGSHKISLDKVIKTMQETGRDMMSKYKETSQGGLATNYIEC